MVAVEVDELLDGVSVDVDVVVKFPEADVVSVVVVAGLLVAPETGDEVPVMIPPTAPVPVLYPESVDLYSFIINMII